MRTTVYILLATLMFLGIGVACSAQQTSNKVKKKKSTIEIFFPVQHFFDDTKASWSIFSRNDGLEVGHGARGLQYNTEISKRGSITLSMIRYGTGYGYGLNKPPGWVVFRGYRMYSAGYMHKLSVGNTFSSYALGGVNYRVGDELIHLYYTGGFLGETRAEFLALKDIGLTAGLRLEQAMPYNMLLSAEVKFTRFVSRYDAGVDFDGGRRRANVNTLGIKLGLGYQFSMKDIGDRYGKKVTGKKNTLEVYFVAYDFFDETHCTCFTRPALLGQSRAPILNMGLQYRREISERGSILLSMINYYIAYDFRSIVVWRDYILPSVGYSYRLSKDRPFSTYLLGAVTYKHGHEALNIAAVELGEFELDSLFYRDFGLTAGLRAEQSILNYFLVSAEARFTRFVYRFDKGIDFHGENRRAKANLMTLKIGLGYRF